MKYLCMIYSAEENTSAMAKAEREQMTSDYFAFTNDIRQKGHYVAGEALQPVSTATTIRVRHGQTVTTDGPFAETTEQLGGFYLIEARDLNEAIQVAAKIPSAKFGSIEVRPIMDFSASRVARSA